MITRETIKKLAKKYQTREENVAREYIQHLFFVSFVPAKRIKKSFLKGEQP